MDPAVGMLYAPISDRESGIEGVFACANCGRYNIASQSTGGPAVRKSTYTDRDDANRHDWSNADWLPRHLESRRFDDVPAHIAEAATETTLCFSLGAYRAVGSLARAVIEATCKDKGADGSKLYDRIERLHELKHVREHTKEQAHEIRHFGNDMAHGDFVEGVTRTGAEEIIELMKEILNEVYQSPARLDRMKSAREGKAAP